MVEITKNLQWIVDNIGGELATHADPSKEIIGIAPIDRAKSNEIGFLTDSRYRSHLRDTQAGAVILTKDDLPTEVGQKNFILHQRPYLLYARLSHLFDNVYKQPINSDHRVHSSAVIDSKASLADDVQVGPQAVIETGVRLSKGVVVGAGCYIGKDVHIGHNTWLHPRVVLHHDVTIGSHCIIHSGAVIGGDGYGFAMDEDKTSVKIYHSGTVRIGNYVEIGSNTTIDRGALNDTVIDDHVQVDNLVMIAHNCRVGKKTCIVAQVGVSGSTQIGDNCMLAGQVGIAGHLKITDNVVVAGKTGVTGSIDKSGEYNSRVPLQTKKDWQKTAIAYRHLAELREQVKQLWEQSHLSQVENEQ